MVKKKAQEKTLVKNTENQGGGKQGGKGGKGGKGAKGQKKNAQVTPVAEPAKVKGAQNIMVQHILVS